MRNQRLQFSERNVRRAVIRWLARQGYARNLREKETAERGVDIQVRHNQYPRYFRLEIKGEPGRTTRYAGSLRSAYVVQALGQLVTRMGTAARYRYGLGFPETYRSVILRRLPWRFCKAANLCVLLVSATGKVSCVTWRELRLAAELKHREEC